MLRNLTLSIIERESIQTLVTRAKELRWYADHVVTLAKRGDVASRRRMIQLLGSTENTGSVNRVRTAVDRVYKELVPRFKDRTGGYTQILRLATRRAGDNSEMCIIQYLPSEDGQKDKKATDKKAKKAKGKEVSAAAPEDKKAKGKKEASKKEAEDKAPAKSKKADKEKA